MKIRDKVIIVISVASFVVGAVLTFLGLFLPPTGEINNGVLIAVGQFLTLCATGLGVKEYVDGRIITEELRHSRHKGGDDE